MPRARIYFGSSAIPYVYVVDHSVGESGANKREDVLLVQFFLKAIMQDAMGKIGYRPPNERPVTVDGNCGPQTIRYIKYYQEENSKRNIATVAPLKVDGRVDVYGSGSVQEYTITALNSTYRARVEPGMYLDLRKHGDFPKMISDSFFIG